MRTAHINDIIRGVRNASDLDYELPMVRTAAASTPRTMSTG